MSIANALLNVLGLTSTVNQAANVITASRSAITIINAAKDLLDSDAGKAFREKVVEITSVAKEEEDGSVHFGDAEKPVPSEVKESNYARGEYVFDPFKGWVWKPE